MPHPSAAWLPLTFLTPSGCEHQVETHSPNRKRCGWFVAGETGREEPAYTLGAPTLGLSAWLTPPCGPTLGLCALTASLPAQVRGTPRRLCLPFPIFPHGRGEASQGPPLTSCSAHLADRADQLLIREPFPSFPREVPPPQGKLALGVLDVAPLDSPKRRQALPGQLTKTTAGFFPFSTRLSVFSLWLR